APIPEVTGPLGHRQPPAEKKLPELSHCDQKLQEETQLHATVCHASCSEGCQPARPAVCCPALGCRGSCDAPRVALLCRPACSCPSPCCPVASGCSPACHVPSPCQASCCVPVSCKPVVWVVPARQPSCPALTCRLSPAEPLPAAD
ncbi:hypothetical protein E2I00_019759, partial [Balaenoptera physalus]